MNYAAAVVVGCLAMAEVAGAQGAAVAVPAGLRSVPALQTTHQGVFASLQRISDGSALWREALRSLEGRGRRIRILTANEVLVADREWARPPGRFDPRVLAEAFPVVGPNSDVATVVVVVNLALLDHIHDLRDSLPGERATDLDRILVHEIYGHAVPYLQVGHLSGRCSDPAIGERAVDACAIKRENAVRAELGLGRRMDSGLNGLILGSELHSRLLRPAFLALTRK
jgi:hypothetical protein